MKDMELRRTALSYLADGHTYKETAKAFKVNTVTLEEWKRRVRETGDCKPLPFVHPPRKLFPDKLREYMDAHCDATLREIAASFGCSQSAVGKALKRLGITRKKNAVLPRPPPERREEFLQAMSQIPKRRVVYVDETGMNEYFYRQHAWSPKGKPVLGWVRFKRLGVVAGLCCGKLVSPWVYDGHMNSRRFEWWFAEKLLPALPAGSVVVLDNAAFHNKRRLRELAATRQITVIFLPPYSPDLNPIEHTWHWLKDWVRKHIIFHDSLKDAVLMAILWHG